MGTNTGSIGDYVWNDANKNGIQDAGEVGVGGVTVKLEDQWGSVLATTTSAADGSYHFNNLAAGCYQVQFVAPTGSTFTGQHWTADGSFASGIDSDAWGGNGITQLIMLAAGQVNNTIDAGLIFNSPAPAPGTASIGDRVWNDANTNGIQDAGEAGVGGVTVKLEDVSGNVLATTTSAADGSYHFNNLAAGSYQVQFVAPTNYIFTGQHWTPDGSFSSGVDSDAWGGNGITQVITLAAGQVNNTIDAGLIYCPPAPPPATSGTASGTIWNDANDNGIRDGSEPGLGGVTVKLEDTSGNVLQTTTTAADGTYHFNNVAPGTYEVQVVAPTNYMFSPEHASGSNVGNDSDVGANGVTSSFTVTAGQTSTNDAGLFYCPPAPPPAATGVIGDYVWNDTNKNGIQDAGEAGIGGVTVKLEDASGNVLQTVTTASDGSYHFSNVAAGNYEVQFVAPANYSFSPEYASGSNVNNDSDANFNGLTQLFSLAAGQINNSIDAGLVYTPPAPPPATASIGDFVWNDANNNGIQDAGEAGVVGVVVKLEDASGNVLQTTATASDGSYHFNNLAAGTYEVQVVAPTNYMFSPEHASGSTSANDSDVNVNGLTAPITLSTGQVNNTIDAGLFYCPPAPPPATASIGDFVWNDTNKNGIQDAGETGIAGVTVRLEDANGNVLQTTTTASDGSYHFNNLAAGNYEVQFLSPANYAFTTQHAAGSTTANDSDANGSGLTSAISLAAGQASNAIDAGLFTDSHNASISGLAWWEWISPAYNFTPDGIYSGQPWTPQSGFNSAMESIGAGISVTLTGAGADGKFGTADDIHLATVTNSTGDYSFGNLAAGQYQLNFARGAAVPLWMNAGQVAETQGWGYGPEHAPGSTTLNDSDVDSQGNTAILTVGAGQQVTHVDADLTFTISPLVLDLNGDGVHTQSVSAGVKFDLLNSGTPVQTGWVDKTDGLLALDLNGDGKIDSGAELFGQATQLADGTTAQNGFQALAQYDSNGDGVIDAKDAVYSQLRVWVDANSDGVSQPDELLTLAQAGVASISLANTAGSATDNGNTLGLVGSYTTTSGTTQAMDDVWFQYAPTSTAAADTSAAGTATASPVVTATATATPASTTTAPTASDLLTPSNDTLDKAFGPGSHSQQVQSWSGNGGSSHYEAASHLAHLMSEHAARHAA